MNTNQIDTELQGRTQRERNDDSPTKTKKNQKKRGSNQKSIGEENQSKMKQQYGKEKRWNEEEGRDNVP